METEFSFFLLMIRRKETRTGADILMLLYFGRSGMPPRRNRQNFSGVSTILSVRARAAQSPYSARTASQFSNWLETIYCAACFSETL